MKEKDGHQPMVHHKSRQPQRVIVESLAFWFAPEITVRGIENLLDTQELISEGKKIVFAANHLSHVDHTIFATSLKRSGFGEIAKKTIPLEGLRVDNTPIANWFIPAYNTILVWPPTITPETEEERQKKFSKKNLEFIRHFINFSNFCFYSKTFPNLRDFIRY